MYETLHTERLESPSIYGVVFIAQLLGGKLRFGAKLHTPLRKYENDFEIWDHEWEREHSVYTLDLGPIYSEVFAYNETKEWVEKVVRPWAIEQARAYLMQQVESEERRIDRLLEEIGKLPSEGEYDTEPLDSTLLVL